MPQKTIMKQMEEFGYKNTDFGICEGYCMMGIQAFLAGDFQSFIDRVIYLRTHAREISEHLRILNKKIALAANSSDPSAKVTLTKEEEKINDIRSFFDGIRLYQQPTSHTDLFGQFVQQGMLLKIAPLVDSIALTEKGGLRAFCKWPGIYPLEQLRKYIYLLQTTALKYQQDLAFKLDGHQHTIALLFNKTNNSWYLINANVLNITYIPNDSLASAVAVSFFRKAAHGDLTVAFETTVINIDSSYNGLLAFINDITNNIEFKKIHEISRENAFLRTRDGDTLLHLTARNGHLDMTSKLIKQYNGDLNMPTPSGISPLNLAAYYGHLDIIKLAKDNGVDLNSPRSFYSTAYCAIQSDQEEILKELVENSNLKQSPEELMKLLEFAKKEKMPKCIRYFEEYSKSILKNAEQQSRLFSSQTAKNTKRKEPTSDTEIKTKKSRIKR